MGLRIKGDNPVLLCSNDDTVACYEGGKKDNGIELLKREIKNCKDSHSSFCIALTSELEASTKGVTDWCNGNKNIPACITAEKALKALCKKDNEKSDKYCGVPPQIAKKAFQKGNCKKLADEMIRKRKETASDDGLGKAYSNKFWQDMIDVAGDVCKEKGSNAIKAMGVCHIDKSTDKYVQRKRKKIYRKDSADYDRCLYDLKTSYGNEINKIDKKLNKVKKR